MQKSAVSRETARLLEGIPEVKIVKLQEFVNLLDRWRKITDLISERAFGDVWKRHVIDSLFIQRTQPNGMRWLDFGSGAGFPAAVIAIMLSDRSDAQVHCVESDGRKCAFLREVAEAARLPLKIHQLRAENLSPQQVGSVDVVTARAFAPINKIIEISEKFLSEGAVAALPRGKTYTSDIEQIDRNKYTFDLIANPDSSAGVVLRIAGKV